MGTGISVIIPDLYVGSFRDVKNREEIDKLGITHILAIHDTAKQLYQDKQYLCIHASDSLEQDLKGFFSTTNTFIHEARLNGGKVVVHCLAGMSRSVAVAIAYVMSISDLDWRDAYHVVFMQRRSARPNMSFQRQLGEFERSGMQEERERLSELGQSPYREEERKIYRQTLRDWDKWVRFGDQQITQAHLNNEYSLEPDQYKTRESSSKRQQNTTSTVRESEKNVHGGIAGLHLSDTSRDSRPGNQRSCRDTNRQSSQQAHDSDSHLCSEDEARRLAVGNQIPRDQIEPTLREHAACDSPKLLEASDVVPNTSEHASHSMQSAIKQDTVEKIFARNYKLHRS